MCTYVLPQYQYVDDSPRIAYSTCYIDISLQITNEHYLSFDVVMSLWET